MCGKPEGVDSWRKDSAAEDDYMDYLLEQGKYAPHSTVEDGEIEVFEAKRDPITWVDVSFFAITIALAISAIVMFFS